MATIAVRDLVSNWKNGEGARASRVSSRRSSTAVAGTGHSSALRDPVADNGKPAWLLSQQLVDKRDRDRPFADSRGDAFDIASTNIPGSENSGQAGFQ